MKRIFFASVSAAALLAGAPALAQSNTSTVTQTGNGGNVMVEQIGLKDNSDVSQASGATANVKQAGQNSLSGFTPDQYPNNRSQVTQTASAGGAMADVDQNGSLNRSSITQRADADATVKQTGTYNNSTVQQSAAAAGATATVTQGGDYGDNRSSVIQRGASDAMVMQTNIDPVPLEFGYPGNESDITQTGDNSSATVNQTGDDNRSTVNQAADATATVGQTGTDNMATTDQSAAATSNIEQGNFDSTSSGNTATVTQSAGGAFSDVNQNGRGNDTTIRQSGTNSDSFAYTEGENNTVDVNQSGARSVAVTIQRDFIEDASPTPAQGNTAEVRQRGADTYSYIAQDGSGNSANVTLRGQGVAKARYTTSAGYVINEPAESVVLQIGVNNAAMVEQVADRAKSNIYQGTIFNGSEVYLANGSSNNTATVRQRAGATESRSDIFQGGDNNIAMTEQSAADSFADVRQDGTGNTSNVSQSGGSGHNAYVTQYADNNTSNITQSGMMNTATVSQYSDGNMSTVMQSGNGNTAIVTQGMMSSGGAQ